MALLQPRYALVMCGRQHGRMCFTRREPRTCRHSSWGVPACIPPRLPPLALVVLVLAAGPASLAVAHSRCSTRCLCRLQPKPRCVPVLRGACVRADLPRVLRD